MTSPVSPGSSQPHSHEELKQLYQQSIGGTFFRQMMKALRATTGKAAYFNGGQAEKIFQGQLDELMIEKLSEASGGVFSDALFEQQFPALAEPGTPTPPNAVPNKESAQADSKPSESPGFDARI
jgi:hypothetical protein